MKLELTASTTGCELPESPAQRWLWITNVFFFALTAVMYKDNVAVVIRLVLISVIPLVLQVRHTYDDSSSVATTRKLGVLGSMAGSLVAIIFIAAAVATWVTNALTDEGQPNKVWAPQNIRTTWSLMYAVECSWQVLCSLLALFQNIYFIGRAMRETPIQNLHKQPTSPQYQSVELGERHQ